MGRTRNLLISSSTRHRLLAALLHLVAGEIVPLPPIQPRAEATGFFGDFR
ncbi:MAG: hypothetical protein V7K86_24435 [Nostoc sp.]